MVAGSTAVLQLAAPRQALLHPLSLSEQGIVRLETEQDPASRMHDPRVYADVLRDDMHVTKRTF